MDVRRFGMPLAIVGVLGIGLLTFTDPLPGDDALLVDFPSSAEYDATNDTTRARFGFCDHEPCGQEYEFRGNMTKGFEDGPWMVVQGDGGLMLRAVMPSLLRYLAAVALVGVGVALMIGARWSATAPGLAVGWIAYLVGDGELGVVFGGFAGWVLLLAALVAAIILAGKKKSPQIAALALGIAMVAMIAAGWIAMRWLPTGMDPI